tara:strand:- start:246 stop:920 length:675 start_codon:yes stop_codon:yes gene_type:complete
MKRTIREPLWAEIGKKNDKELTIWKALLLACVIEFVIPFIFFVPEWKIFDKKWEQDPTPLISAYLLDERKPLIAPNLTDLVEQKKDTPKINKLVENMEQIPLKEIKPLPNEEISDMQIPGTKIPEKEDEPEDLAPLPSVFQDIKPVKKVIPKYPKEAEANKIEGTVKVRMFVNIDGSVGSVNLISSDPAGVFDAVVIQAAEQFVFKPDGSSYTADEVFIFIIDP